MAINLAAYLEFSLEIGIQELFVLQKGLRQFVEFLPKQELRNKEIRESCLLHKPFVYFLLRLYMGRSQCYTLAAS